MWISTRHNSSAERAVRMNLFRVVKQSVYWKTLFTHCLSVPSRSARVELSLMDGVAETIRTSGNYFYTTAERVLDASYHATLYFIFFFFSSNVRFDINDTYFSVGWPVLIRTFLGVHFILVEASEWLSLCRAAASFQKEWKERFVFRIKKRFETSLLDLLAAALRVSALGCIVLRFNLSLAWVCILISAQFFFQWNAIN